MKCDSCEEEKSILFPLAVLDELPSGGEKMVVKYYCKDCYDVMTEEAENEEMDDTDNNGNNNKDEDE